MNTLLVALDLKNSDSELLRYTASFANKFQSKVWLIHIAAPDPDFVGYSVGPTYIRDVRAEELRKEHKHLQELAADLKSKNINADALLIQGPTIDILKSEVAKLKVDLLIMGSHRHGFMYETFIGNTSVQAIKKIHIPVLIIPLINEE